MENFGQFIIYFFFKSGEVQKVVQTQNTPPPPHPQIRLWEDRLYTPTRIEENIEMNKDS